jgi:hypothetical protein
MGSSCRFPESSQQTTVGLSFSYLIPWHQFEDEYCATLSKKRQDPPAFSVRMALAALIMKERLRLSDEECVEQIRENPYLRVEAISKPV